MHQPFIHMMQRSGDRNSCGYAGGPQPFFTFAYDEDAHTFSCIDIFEPDFAELG